MTALELALLIVAFILFVVAAIKDPGGRPILLALGLASWVAAEVVTRWPG